MELIICFKWNYLRVNSLKPESSFLFDNFLYKQIYGAAIDSLFRNYFSKCILMSLPKTLAWQLSTRISTWCTVYRRYVDNISFLFKSKYHLLLFARYINTRHKTLKFTFDFEQNNSFPLDVNITRANKGFRTYFSFS